MDEWLCQMESEDSFMCWAAILSMSSRLRDQTHILKSYLRCKISDKTSCIVLWANLDVMIFAATVAQGCPQLLK